jgi:hypothetical protein
VKRILFLINVFIFTNLYANDTWVESAGGGYTLLDVKNQSVKMISENIKIDLYDNYYEMNIEFIFFNYGDTVELKVGFPEYSYGTGNITNIRNFQTSVNNENVEVEMVKNLNNTLNFNFGYKKINSWYVKNVVFNANEYTVTKVHYRADYANYGYYNSVEYLYGTGSTWNDKIDQIVIEITNHTNYWLYRTIFNVEKTTLRRNNNTIEIRINNIYPEIADDFSICFSDFPAFEMPQFEVSERRWRLAREIITDEELILLNKEQLRILRNSIYAFHGYKFMSIDLQNYFNRQNWYKINNNFTENNFSENEKTNLKNIISEENKRN